MQNLKDLYLELKELISINIESVKWIDLWNRQVYNLENEHSYPTPAVFLAFRSNSMSDTGLKVQNVLLQVDVFVHYETFLDNFKEAYNPTVDLGFLDIMDRVNQLFHGSSGENYSSMRRVSYGPVDTVVPGNLWNITYNCNLMDYSAMKEIGEGAFKDVEIKPFDI